MQILKKILNPFHKQLILVVIFVEYNRQKCGGSDNVFTTLQGYLAKIPDCKITYLRLDNKHPEASTTKSTRVVYTLGGDNSFREFSGWQKGVDTCNNMGLEPDLLLFVNDMFLKPGASFLEDYASSLLLKKSLQEKKIIGRIDSTGQHYTALGYDTSQWVCTNCFLAPATAISRLGDMVSIKKNLDEFLPKTFPGPQEDPTAFFLANAPINQAYKTWLAEWLTERWHSKFVIEETTWELFRTKVRNILNESLLTARLAELGFMPEKYGDKYYY